MRTSPRRCPRLRRDATDRTEPSRRRSCPVRRRSRTPCRVLVDVTDVTFFSSEGLRFLSRTIGVVADGHGRVVTLHNPDQPVWRTVELFGMLDRLVVTSD
jgi:hypothetical protein